MVVTLAEPLPNYETRRLLQSLRELGTPVRAIFVNRVLREQSPCPRCQLAASGRHSRWLN